RSLGTERPSFSPPQENELAQPSGPRDAALREPSEPRFEERFQEAERRVRGERTRRDEEGSRGEERMQERSTRENVVARRSEDRARPANSEQTAQERAQEAAQQDTDNAETQSALEALRFSGAEPVATLPTIGQGTTQGNGNPPAKSTLDLNAFQAIGAPLGTVAGNLLGTTAPAALDSGTLSTGDLTGTLGTIATTTNAGGQTGSGSSFAGGEQPGAGQASSAAATTSATPTGAAEAFGTLLSTELTEASATDTTRPELGARTTPPSQREIELAGDVLRQFRMQMQPGLNEATIHLRPAHLGRVAIRLSVEDGRLRATLRAEKSETLGILESHLPELRAALEGQGFEAQEFDLGLGDSNSSGFEEFFHEEQPSFASASRLSQDSHLEENELLRNAVQQRLDSENPSVDTYA
ncbi:MAG: flagellar hook-length control protein FliK, partial [Planctomycetota bacterium]